MSVSVTSVEQFINFGLSLFTMQVSKAPFFENVRVVWFLRILYILSSMTNLGLLYFIKQKIQKTNDQRKMKLIKEPSMFQDVETEGEVEITNAEYDAEEANKAYKSALVQIVIVIVLHLKWRAIQPLIVQSTIPFRNIILSPLFSAYLWNKQVLRPFEQNMLFQKLASAAPEKKRKKED